MNFPGSGAPFFYDYVNQQTSAFTPSTVHVSNTGLSNFFRRYLLQKAFSVFKWTMPETWSRDYFLYCLYCWIPLHAVFQFPYNALTFFWPVVFPTITGPYTIIGIWCPLYKSITTGKGYQAFPNSRIYCAFALHVTKHSGNRI